MSHAEATAAAPTVGTGATIGLLASMVRIRRLLGLVQSWSRYTTQIVIASIALEVTSMLNPIVLKELIDHAFASNVPHGIGSYLVILVGFLLVQIVLYLARALLQQQFEASINVSWVSDSAKRLFQLSFREIGKRQIGEILSVFRSVEEVQRILSGNLFGMVIDLLGGAVALGLLLVYNWQMALVGVMANGIYLLVRHVFRTKLQHRGHLHLTKLASENSFFIGCVNGLFSIKQHGAEAQFFQNWFERYVAAVRAGVAVQRANMSVEGAGRAISGMEGIAIIAIAYFSIVSSQMSLGTFFAFLTLNGYFSARLISAIDKFGALHLIPVHLRRLNELLPPDAPLTALSSPAQPSRAPVARTPAPVSVDIDSVSFGYTHDADILSNFSLSVAPGEHLVIVGRSGSGKSTLARLMLNIITPSRGTVHIQRHATSANGEGPVIAAVMDDDYIFEGTIVENITMFSPVDHELLDECLENAGLSADIGGFPHGKDTVLGQGGGSMSAGQRQRTLLARALYRRPDLLILDEVTSRLDPATAHAIDAAIDKMRMTRISITHSPERIASASRVIDLERL